MKKNFFVKAIFEKGNPQSKLVTGTKGGNSVWKHPMWTEADMNKLCIFKYIR